jgi:hypothetical protein
MWMISSKGTEERINFFLNFIKARSPEIMPVIIMSDYDHVQMNAIKAIYSESMLLLCWWHVLCAMQTHFCTEEFLKLWEHVHGWVKTPDQSQFESWWEEMQADPAAPQSFIDYLRVNWMPITSLWSGSAHKNQTIYQEGNTNMLIKAEASLSHIRSAKLLKIYVYLGIIMYSNLNG